MARKMRGKELEAMYSGRAAENLTPMQLLDQDEHAPARKSRAKDLKLEKVMYRLEARQIAALRAEARRRADEKAKAEGRSTIRDDASEVLREVLDAWIAKSAK